jgi:hypothetical protein
MNPKLLSSLLINGLLLLFALPSSAIAGNVLINELSWMGTAVSANDEWLELFNPTENEIDLAGWRLEAADGSPKINLSGQIAAQGFFLLERTDDETVPGIAADQIYAGSMGNDGEWLKLFDANNNLIDALNAADGWPGGNNETKQTLERNSAGSWQTGALPLGTPKAANSELVSAGDPPPGDGEEELPPNENDPESENQPESLPLSTAGNPAKNDLIISEVFPNPDGPDFDREFIEILNVSGQSLNLNKCRIVNSLKQEYIIGNITLAPNDALAFYRPETKISLNNNKDKITLYNATGKIIDEINFKTPAPSGQSWQKNSEAGHPVSYCWAQPTPEAKNFCGLPFLPTPVISGPAKAQVFEFLTYDASDSYDPKGRPLQFTWSFGDGRVVSGPTANQIYLKPGTYEIGLTARADDTASSTAKIKIKVIGAAGDIFQPATSTATTTVISQSPGQPPAPEENNFLPDIFISEFLPDPADDENNEFIEIFSNENQPFDLAGFQLTNGAPKTRPYVILPGTIIRPGQYLAFFRRKTKIALNNDGDQVRLLSPAGQIVDQATYEKTKSGASFVLDENFIWQQSPTPTPGEINVLAEIKTDQETVSSTPKVLGAQTEIKSPAEIINAEPPKNKPKNKFRYLISAFSGAIALAIGAVYKWRKTKNPGL